MPVRFEALAGTRRWWPTPDLTGSVDPADASSTRTAELAVQPGVRGSCARWSS